MDDDALNSSEMALRILETIKDSDPKIMIYTPDALIRVFVFLAISNGWTLEKIQSEAKKGIEYYYFHKKNL